MKTGELRRSGLVYQVNVNDDGFSKGKEAIKSMHSLQDVRDKLKEKSDDLKK